MTPPYEDATKSAINLHSANSFARDITQLKYSGLRAARVAACSDLVYETASLCAKAEIVDNSYNDEGILALTSLSFREATPACVCVKTS